MALGLGAFGLLICETWIEKDVRGKFQEIQVSEFESAQRAGELCLPALPFPCPNVIG